MLMLNRLTTLVWLTLTDAQLFTRKVFSLLRHTLSHVKRHGPSRSCESRIGLAVSALDTVIFRFKDQRVVTQMPGFTKAATMAVKDCSANCDNIVHCPENFTSALDFNST